MTNLLGAAGLTELRQIAAARSVLAFDFDGTLAPIVRDPDRAAMRPRTRRLLARLALRFPCAVVSGRGLPDLRPRLDGIPIRWLIGNHGAEGGVPFPGAARLRRRVVAWRDAIQAGVDGREGVHVEDKGFSLSLHYRAAPRRDAARAALLDLVQDLPGSRIVRGKCVLNVVLENAPHKGTALAHLVAREAPQRVLFVGDDDTDEDAFRMDLGVPSTTIRVGGRRTSRARYRLADQKAVDRLLEILLLTRTGATEEEE